MEVAANETRLERLGVEVKEKLGFLGAIEEGEDITAARDMALNRRALSIQLFPSSGGGFWVEREFCRLENGIWLLYCNSSLL